MIKWIVLGLVLALIVGAIAWYDNAHNRRDDKQDPDGWGT